MPYLMNNTGFIYTLETALKMLLEFQVIFIGEEHLSRESHEAELAVLTGLVGHDPNLVLALEMFERDIQPLLDDYLKGVISEEQFLEGSRPVAQLPRGLPPPGGIGQTQGPPGHRRQCPPESGCGRGQGQPSFQEGDGPRQGSICPRKDPMIPRNTNDFSWPPCRECPPWDLWARLIPRGCTRDNS